MQYTNEEILNPVFWKREVFLLKKKSFFSIFFILFTFFFFK